MFKYNQAANGAPKVGFSGGDGFPPCKVLVAFRKAKESVSANKKAGTAGQPMVVTEWDVMQVIRKDYDEGGYKNWDGQILTVKEGLKRSYVIKLQHAGALGDLNELAALLHGINTKNPAAMRAAGLTAKDDSAVELDRLANAYNEMIGRVLSEDGTNPFLDYLFEVEISARTNETTKRTFMRHTFTFPSDPAALAHNASILATIGRKLAA